MVITPHKFRSDQRFGRSHQWSWNGWTIHYTHHDSEHSDLTPVLLVHGFGASIGHWRHNIQPVAAHRPVYALDLLGFGGSAKPEISYTVDVWIDQVFEFWNAFLQKPTILVGHSVGALVILLAAARYPQIAKGLCLISCADGPHPDELPQPFEWLVQGFFEVLLGLIGCPLTYPLLFNWLRQPEVLRAWIKNIYKKVEVVDDDLVTLFLEPAFDPGAEYVFLDALRAVLTRRFSSPKRVLPEFKAPILLLWGKEDPAVPSFLADKFKAWQPSIDLVKIPGVGHCAHDEVPFWVNTLLLEWVASLEPTYALAGLHRSC